MAGLLDRAWIPHDGEFSPCVGAGLGIVGVETSRLHGVRLLAGVNAVLPCESRPGADSIHPGVHLRLGLQFPAERPESPSRL